MADTNIQFGGGHREKAFFGSHLGGTSHNCTFAEICGVYGTFLKSHLTLQDLQGSISWNVQAVKAAYKCLPSHLFFPAQPQRRFRSPSTWATGPWS